MTTYKSRQAPPRASAMIEALRGLGYSPSTALADIIDNSIAAGATKVELSFTWKNKESYITVLDDGRGMDEAELDSAMRLGEKSPLDVRESHDLGRFGLGLKTASFSQCRSLTVASKRQSFVSCLRWDLDVLENSPDGGWHLLEGPQNNSQPLLEALEGRSSGTLVILEKMDRIITDGFTDQDFLDLIDNIERHLGMVFHRYLAGPRSRLTLLINKIPVAPWDPFLSNHPATWSSPIETIASASGNVEVQCHVLPHKDKLDPKELERAGGPDGWTGQQGFYVYRNERLLLAGSWLGLGHGKSWTKEEAHRLARIRLDIPNSADADWKIDIRKSVARPPVWIRNRLLRLAEDTRARARRVFAHRGQGVRLGEAPVQQAWKAEYGKDGMRYRIDDTHPFVKSVLEESGELLPQIKAMLRIIEETIPVQRIWLDTAENKETPRTGFAQAPSSEVATILGIMYKNMITKKGISPANARALLLKTEPFQNYPNLVGSLQDDIKT